MKNMLGVVVLVASVAIASNVCAGTLGRQYAGVNIGHTTLAHIDDSAISLGAALHFPISGNVDGDVAVVRTGFESDIVERGTSVGGLLELQLLPGAKANPFLTAGVLWYESGSGAKSDWGTGCVFGCGTEVNVSQRISMSALANYEIVKFGKHDTLLSVGIDAWIAEQVLLSLSGSYALDSESEGISAGVAMAF